MNLLGGLKMKFLIVYSFVGDMVLVNETRHEVYVWIPFILLKTEN